MTPRGRGGRTPPNRGGRTPPNRGGRIPPNRGGLAVHVGERASPNTDSPISSTDPTTMESTRPICEGPPVPTVQERHADHFVGESSPVAFSTEPTMNQPSPVQGSVATEYECDNEVDQRPWLHAEKGE